MERLESAVNHIALDKQDEAVKQFVLSLPADRSGSVLELNGQPIVCVVPAAVLLKNEADEPWTDEKNTRRCALIDREIEGTLTPEETLELRHLQAEVIRYRERIAPLPIEDARKLHQELLERARRREASGS